MGGGKKLPGIDADDRRLSKVTATSLEGQKTFGPLRRQRFTARLMRAAHFDLY